MANSFSIASSASIQRGRVDGRGASWPINGSSVPTSLQFHRFVSRPIPLPWEKMMHGDAVHMEAILREELQAWLGLPG